MQKDTGANGGAPRPIEDFDDPPLPPYSIYPAHIEYAIPKRELSARELRVPAVPQARLASPAHTAPESRPDTDSIIRRADEQLLHLAEAARRYLRRYEKANVALEQVLLQRTQIIHVRRQGYDQRRFINDSQDAFLQEASSIIDLLPPGKSLDKLHTLHTQVRLDHEHRSQHVQKTQEVEEEIADLEWELQLKVTRLAQAAKKLHDALTDMTLPEYPAEELSAPSTITESEKAVVPPLVLHYFEKLGDVKLAQERLINLQIDHRDTRFDRMAKIDQGRPPSTTDEDFENAFTREYQEAQAAYDDAVRKAELAWQVCLGEGHNPDDFRKPPSETEKDGGSQAVASDAAVEASDTQSDGDVGIKEVLRVPGSAPMYEQLTTAMDASIYAAWPQQVEATSPVEERVQDWLHKQFLADPWEATERRRRSRSEARQNYLRMTTNEHGRQEVSEESSELRKQQRYRDLPSMVRRLVDDDDGNEQPILLRRSSSESELFVLPLQHRDRDETLNGLRGFTVQLP